MHTAPGSELAALSTILDKFPARGTQNQCVRTLTAHLSCTHLRGSLLEKLTTANFIPRYIWPQRHVIIANWWKVPKGKFAENTHVYKMCRDVDTDRRLAAHVIVLILLPFL